jgi:hypothetical protein
MTPKDLTPVDTRPCEKIDTPAGQKAVMSALAGVAEAYGNEIAVWVELVWRKETGNFKSGFTTTCGAGMHPWAPKYPWGWRDAKTLWDEHPEYRPIGYRTLTEGGTKRARVYLVFPNPTAFAMTLAHIITTRYAMYGDLRRAVGSWYSKNEKEARKYAADAQIWFRPVFCEKIIK